MARASIWLQKFDREAEFIVTRAITLGGNQLRPGDPFPKTAVPLRRLRQLYDSRKIRMGAAAAPAEAASGPGGEPASNAAPAVLMIKHTGFGKYSLFQGEALIAEKLTKAEAEARLHAGVPA